MTPTLEDHERRITVLEERMDEQAGLRASQDRDLAALTEAVRAQDGLLKALAKTQSEHTELLNEHTVALADLKGGVNQIVGMLDVLIAREDGR